MDGSTRATRREFLKGAVVVGGGALASGALAGCAPPPLPPVASAPAPAAALVADNKALVQRAVDEVWNQGNLAAADELYHGHYGHYDPNFQQADDLPGLRFTLHSTANRAVSCSDPRPPVPERAAQGFGTGSPSPRRG